jgi:hypothetical protein
MAAFKFPFSTKQFIHGEYVESKGSERITLRSAVDDSIIADGRCFLLCSILKYIKADTSFILIDVPCADKHDVDLAVESAEKALPLWRQTSPVYFNTTPDVKKMLKQYPGQKAGGSPAVCRSYSRECRTARESRIGTSRERGCIQCWMGARICGGSF